MKGRKRRKRKKRKRGRKEEKRRKDIRKFGRECERYREKIPLDFLLLPKFKRKKKHTHKEKTLTI